MALPFSEKLKLELTVTAGEQAFAIPGGQVRDFSLRMTPTGFRCELTFWTALEKADAALFTAFSKPDLVRVRLALSGVFDPPPAPLVVQGIVTEKRVGGTAHGNKDSVAVAFRQYTVTFEDPARVLWKQHRPVELHTAKKLSELLDAHKPGGLLLTYDWDALEAKHAMVCLGIGDDHAAASFYDFVLWFVDTRGGVLTYDSPKDTYTFSAKKPATGTVTGLSRKHVSRVDVEMPPVIRHSTRVLNGFGAGATTVALEQSQAVAGIQHDMLVRTPIATEAEQRQSLEKGRLRVRKRRLRLTFLDMPPIALHPGALIKLDGGRWSPDLTGLGEDHRVAELAFDGVGLQAGPHDGQQETMQGYTVSLSVLLEQKSDPVPELPAYRPPRYPIYVEGKMHSPGGEAMDRIYLQVDDQKTSVTNYRVAIPLWNKTVSVPAEPGEFPGEFYFPPYKNERVLVALHFDHAALHRFLDWGEGVRMPQDSQGDQILFGKNGTNQTALTHDFQDNKPVWNLGRVNSNDTEIIRLSEGHLLIQTKENPGGAATTPTYDVTPQVETAKGDLTAGVDGAVSDATAAYKESSAAVNSKLNAATEETSAALAAAEAQVKGKAAESRAKLTGALNGVDGQTGALSGAAAEAKAALAGLK
ncbi:hypothetical protein COCOR_04154 [Corallococcus coralloides DSM 2259]|uniref:Gp5/Type VI secretion system Vgr protein OB-fold domain-containing protein n=1 Tax=Corallococcus coralloides (strain ATCC 25202 / DSM 2259 / NBRC 100086 / M2) TaxID=1144275 RepID=H8MXE7_CORCM|nr:hypothetical protein [Corallococcus coralloides]AFE05672.1 hypothetical protein COCOR_04154 [Corallococcus coralloides DSM 2259]